MIIKKIKIQGYRSLKNISITDLSEINIFYGENNTGKSNIIEALNLFFCEKKDFIDMGGKEKSKSELNGRIVGYAPLENNDFFNNGEENITIELAFSLNDSDRKQINALTRQEKNTINKKDKDLQIKLIVQRDLQTNPAADIEEADVYYGFFECDSMKLNGTEYVKGNTENIDVVNAIEQYLCNSFSMIDSERQILKEFDDGKTCGVINEKNIKKFLYHLHLSEEIEDRKVLQNIKSTFNQIHDIGEINFSIRGYKSNETHRYDNEKNQLICEKTKESEIRILIHSEQSNTLLPIENFGKGIQQSLIIISNIIGNSKSSLFGIEEIEANLSPNNQKIVYGSITKLKDSSNKMSQLFITSHSDHFIPKKEETINLYKVFHDQKETNRITIMKNSDLYHFFNRTEYIELLTDEFNITNDSKIDGKNGHEYIAKLFNQMADEQESRDSAAIFTAYRNTREKLSKCTIT